MKADYQKWIAEHQPEDPRGQCVDTTLAMLAAFPELRRVRGHYLCPFEGPRPHWWLLTTDGEVIDPTVGQFVSRGHGEYEEYTGPEPTGHCLDCGALLFDGDTFCGEDCFQSTKTYLESGGAISVNGRQVYP